MTDADRAVLDLERRFANQPADGCKEAAALTELGMGRTRYYQVLSRLIETREALEHDPLTVNRLRRLQASRMRTRSA